jgi:hypothetical protein
VAAQAVLPGCSQADDVPGWENSEIQLKLKETADIQPVTLQTCCPPLPKQFTLVEQHRLMVQQPPRRTQRKRQNMGLGSRLQQAFCALFYYRKLWEDRLADMDVSTVLGYSGGFFDCSWFGGDDVSIPGWCFARTVFSVGTREGGRFLGGSECLCYCRRHSCLVLPRLVHFQPYTYINTYINCRRSVDKRSKKTPGPAVLSTCSCKSFIASGPRHP